MKAVGGRGVEDFINFPSALIIYWHFPTELMWHISTAPTVRVYLNSAQNKTCIKPTAAIFFGWMKTVRIFVTRRWKVWGYASNQCSAGEKHQPIMPMDDTCSFCHSLCLLVCFLQRSVGFSSFIYFLCDLYLHVSLDSYPLVFLYLDLFVTPVFMPPVSFLSLPSVSSQ